LLAFYGFRNFFTVFTRTCLWSSPWARQIQYRTLYSYFDKSISVIASHLSPFLPTAFFLFNVPTKQYAFLLYPFCPKFNRFYYTDQGTNYKFKLPVRPTACNRLWFINNRLTQHVSGIIMPIFRCAIPYVTAHGFQHWMCWLESWEAGKRATRNRLTST